MSSAPHSQSALGDSAQLLEHCREGTTTARHLPGVLVSMQNATSQSSSSPTLKQLPTFNHHQLIWGRNEVRVDQAKLKKLNEA